MENNESKVSLPSSIEAEMYVLGSILLDNSLIKSARGRILVDSFSNTINQDIYATMCRLDDNMDPIEPLTIKNIYGSIDSKSKSSEDEIVQHLHEIIDSVPNTVYFETYIKIIIEKKVERDLLRNIDNLRRNIINNKMEYAEIMNESEKSIYDLLRMRNLNDLVHIKDAADEYYKEMERRGQEGKEYTGIITKEYTELDKLTNGFQKGEFVILAARPAVGKTAFALNLARLIALSDEKRYSVAFFSLEMSVEQLMQRMYCMEAMIDSDNIKKGKLSVDELVLIGAARQRLGDLNIYFDDSGSNTIADIRSRCRRLKQKGQLDVLIIDYLQLINNDDKKNRQEEVSQISRSLKQLARELEIPVIALSQLSRSIETRENKMPVLADLRESGSLEQDADIVMFLFKRSDVEEQDDSNFGDNDRDKYEDNIKKIVLQIAKNRQGSTGQVSFDFYGSQAKFVQSENQDKVEPKKKKKKKSDN